MGKTLKFWRLMEPFNMIKLAYDRIGLQKTVRFFDEDGRLYIKQTPISKAMVNPYRGCEIPDFDRLGWEAERFYRLLRPADALTKARQTFEKIPVLLDHIHVTAERPHSESVVGATGEAADFISPYLMNSMVIWDQQAISKIKNGSQRELSCAYRYEVDPTPGVYDGEAYDGVMRNLRGNHIALVEKGRAGPDVCIWDQAPSTKRKYYIMNNKDSAGTDCDRLPRSMDEILRQTINDLDNKTIDPENDTLFDEDLSDESIDNFGDELDNDSEQNFENYKQELYQLLQTLQSQGVDQEALNKIAAIFHLCCQDMSDIGEDELDDEDSDAEDCNPLLKQKAVSKKAKNPLIAKALAKQRKKLKAVEQARFDVMPVVGQVIGQDSAAEIYRVALRELGMNTAKLPRSASVLRELFNMTYRERAYNSRRKNSVMAQDRATGDHFYQFFGVSPMKKIGAF